jgi:hypothetical protein
LEIPGSDLDILCFVEDHNRFIRIVDTQYSHFPAYHNEIKIIENKESTVIGFFAYGFPVEIFAQNIPVSDQTAYKHMIMEKKILEVKGSAFKNEILRMKRQGMKTKTAFARLLGISGDPYTGLLCYEI